MAGLIPILAVAAAATINVPAELGNTVDKASAKSGLDVLIPQTIPFGEKKRVFPDLDVIKGGYTLHLGLVKHCGGAGACYLAYFNGEQDGELLGEVKVKLHKGIKGRFARSTCGANCSAPLISFKKGGVAYTIAVKSVTGNEKRKMKKIANSAIDAGPR